MMEQSFSAKEDDAAKNQVLLTVASEVMLVCSAILLFFVQLEIPLTLAAAASLGAFFAGSLLIWQSFAGAQLLLVFSLFLSQYILLGYSSLLLAPFAAVDIVVLWLLVKYWQRND